VKLTPWDVFAEFDALADPEADGPLLTPDGYTPGERIEQLLRCERNLAAWEAAVKSEADRMAAKLAAVRKRRESIRNHLAGVMRTAGERKYRSPVGTVSLSVGRESIEVDVSRVGEWPAAVWELAVEPQFPKVRKDALRCLLPAELAALPGVQVVRGDDVLTIR
jgi:hypothetical protein